MLNMLLATFWETYGLWIVLIGFFALMLIYNYFRTKKYNQQYDEFVTKIVPGAKVKTQSGFYGTVEKITETTDGKVVTLKISENAYIDVDIRALYNIDEKKTMEEVEMLERLENVSTAEVEPIKQETKEAEVKEELDVENKEESAEVKEETVKPKRPKLEKK